MRAVSQSSASALAIGSEPLRTAPFFLGTFAFTWLLQLPAVLAKHGALSVPLESVMGLAALGAFGPLVAALAVSRYEANGRGALAAFRGLRRWRVGAKWYVLSLGVSGALLAVSAFVYSLLSGNEVRACYPPNTAPAFAAMLLMPWAEEVGWRGLALPRLQRRHGALLGNVFLGVVWAVWHLPMFEVAGVPRSVFPLMLVFFVAGSIVFGWIFNRTHGSLLMMLLAHAGAHLSNSHQPLPADTTPLVLHTTAYALAALLLIGFDRVTFARATSRNALV